LRFRASDVPLYTLNIKRSPLQAPRRDPRQRLAQAPEPNRGTSLITKKHHPMITMGPWT